MAKEKQLTEVEVKALEIRKEKANKEMNVYSSCLNDLEKKEFNINNNVVELRMEEENTKERIIKRKDEVKNVDKVISIKKEDIKEINKEKKVADEQIDYKLGELKKVEKAIEKAQGEVDALLVTKGSLVSKENYVKSQELYIQDQFKRLGLKYQPYA